MCNTRVKGFLDVKGRKLINEDGEEVILSGWGLGNWLLCEGYMWKHDQSPRMDRPRRIEMVVEELTGKEYAADFWKRFRDNYITEEDIRYMAQLGYNSVRIPMNSRLFLEEGPGTVWKEEGFQLVDRCLDWCEKYKMYAFLDLHGAPGGQTGDNIDDSIDNIPRLFVDKDCWDKGVELWKKLAERYKDRWIVGGYDLLNEPIKPPIDRNGPGFEHLLPKLGEFYDEVIKEIRKIDDKHIFSIEGHHWATSTQIFYKKFDDKMMIHFHRYACLPDISCYQEYLELAQSWDCPLWLGETGENIPEWFAAMYPLAAELGIGYNIWPWKKMDCTNSPCSVNMPADWSLIIEYSKGGSHPGYRKAQHILEEYLENMKLANCTINQKVIDSVFRKPGCVIRATDFDELPGQGSSYSGLRQERNIYGFRKNTGMKIVEKYPDLPKLFGFDTRWYRFVLTLAEGEYASYTLNDIEEGASLSIKLFCMKDSRIRIYQDDTAVREIELPYHEDPLVIKEIGLLPSERSVIRIETEAGEIQVDSLITSR